MLYYIESSTLARFAIQTCESGALQDRTASVGDDVVSSDLARTELLRAVRRYTYDLPAQARAVLEKTTFLTLTMRMSEQAGFFETVSLRTLEALHFASALGPWVELNRFVTYDDRLVTAAGYLGIRKVAPV